MISQHKLTLNLLFIQLIIVPSINFIIGTFAQDHKVIDQFSFFYRITFIALFLNALLFTIKTRKLNKNFLSFIFLITIFTGLIKGSSEGTIFNLSSSGLPIAFSNIFALLMPTIMISYGYKFFESYLINKDLSNKFNNLMKYSFFTGASISILFFIFDSLDLYIKSSIGLWNFIYSGPYLFSNLSSGNIYLNLSLIFVFLTKKRAVTVAMSIVFLWLISVLSKKEKLKLFFITLFSTGGFIYFVSKFFSGISLRFEQTIEFIRRGDLDAASSGRFEEAISALNYLSERLDHIIFGAGFGAVYSPFLDFFEINRNYDYEYFTFLRHYSHFSPVSYMWIGGILLSLSVYFFLIFLFLSLSIKVYKSEIPFKLIFIPAYILSFIFLSLFGSGLFNNSFIWLFIGAGLRLNRGKFNL